MLINFIESGWLIELVVKLMKLFSTYEEDVLSLASTLGLYRQIHDDYCNLRHDEVINNLIKLLEPNLTKFIVITGY